MVTDPLPTYDSKKLNLSINRPINPPFAYCTKSGNVQNYAIGSTSSNPDVIIGRDSKKQVLLIEDTPMLQKIHTLFLETIGYSVTLAINGTDALEKYRAAKFDLIVLDIGLPDISGIEVSKQIRFQDKDSTTPILALTTMSQAEIKTDCISAGVNQIANKPILINELKTIISKLLNLN